MKNSFFLFVIAILCLCAKGIYSSAESNPVDVIIKDEEDLLRDNDELRLRNGYLYNQFERAKLMNNDKAGPYYSKAVTIRKAADNLCEYINNIRAAIKKKSQGLSSRSEADTFRTVLLSHPGDLDVPRQLLTGDDISRPVGLAVDLRKKLGEYRMVLLTTIDSVTAQREGWDYSSLKCGDRYSFRDGKFISWEEYNFRNMPVAGALARLTAISNLVRSKEWDALMELFYEMK